MKEQIYNSLIHKNIILFGVWEEAVLFYQKYHHLLHIQFCMTSYSENLTLQPMREYGLETRLFDDVKLTDQDFLVICDDKYYQSIERRLKTENIAEYSGFVNWKLAAAVLERKQLAVFMGSAFMKQIAMGIKAQPDFSEKYFSVFYFEDDLLQPYQNRICEYKHLARLCDAYIVSICDKDMYGSKVFSDSLLLPDCVKISVSDYTFNGYYPQIVDNRDTYSDFLYRERKRLDLYYGTLFLAREDANLKKYVLEKLSPDEIINRVCDEAFYSADAVNENYQNALQNIRKSDLLADIRLADYIEKACVGTVAYRNLDEWNLPMLLYVMERISEKLQLTYHEPDKKALGEKLEETSGSELPVYPSVLKALHISGFDNKKYRIVSYYGIRHMGFEEYMRYCIECMYQIRDMDMFLGGTI